MSLSRDLTPNASSLLEAMLDDFPVDVVERGEEYNHERRVHGLSWCDGKIQAVVCGSRDYDVTIQVEALPYSGYDCDCPAYAHHLLCKHVAAVAMEFQDSEARIGGWNFDEDTRPPLSQPLVTLKKVLQIHLRKSWQLEPTYYCGGKRYDPRDGGFPSSVIYRNSYMAPEDCLWQFFKSPDMDYEIVFIDGETNIPLQLDKKAKLNPTMLYQAEHDRIVVSRIHLPVNLQRSQKLFLGYLFFADLENQVLGRVANKGRWHEMQNQIDIFEGNSERLATYDNQVSDAVVTMTPQEFHSKVLPAVDSSWMSGGKHCIFEEKNCVLTPEVIVAKPALLFRPQEDGVLLSAAFDERRFGVGLSRHLFGVWNNFGASIPKCNVVGFRSQSLRSAMARIACGEELSKVLKELLSDERFVRKRGVSYEARHFLSEYAKDLSFSFVVRQPVYTSSNWKLADIELSQIQLLASVVHTALGKHADAFFLKGQVLLSQDEIAKVLFPLKKFADEVGVSVVWDGKPLSIASGKVDLHVRRVEGEDWFEIHPKVYMKDKKMSQEKWEALLASGGVLHTDDGVYLADQATVSVLQRLREQMRGRTTQFNPEQKINVAIPIPRLRIFDWLELQKLGISIHLPKEDQQIIDGLRRFKTIPRRQEPTSLEATLRPYQKDGYDWLCFLYEHRFGACLADDMGLGKTVQTIALLSALKEKIVCCPYALKAKQPHLLVVPPSLAFNWKEELTRFCKELVVSEYVGGNRSLNLHADIVLTTYDTIRQDIDELQNIQFHTITFDEAQWVKNLSAARTSACRQLNAHFKICLTGTPLENHLGEYQSIMDLCVPGLFESGSRGGVQKKPSTENQVRVVRARTKPFVLRRLKETILKDLPPKEVHDVYLEMTKEQKRLYTRAATEAKRKVEDAYQNNSAGKAGFVALTALLRLRQICISSELWDKSTKTSAPKISLLVQRLKDLRQEGHAAVVFSQFTSALDVLERELAKSGQDWLRLDGSLSLNKRKEIVKEFQDLKGEPKPLLASLKVGGVGLNLTKAGYVFHLDPWWNPAVESQASDRVHRIGQKNKVFVERLLMRHSVEEKIMVLRQRKTKLFEAVVGSADSVHTSLKKADFDFLLA